MIGLEEAQEIAWAALLNAMGEPHVSRREIGVARSFYTDTKEAPESVPYEFFFNDLRCCVPPQSRQKFDPRIGGAWVDKLTGNCRVWINEDFDPPPSRVMPYVTGGYLMTVAFRAFSMPWSSHAWELELWPSPLLRPLPARCSPGDPIELRRPDGTIIHTTIKAMLSRSLPEPVIIVISHLILSSDVPVGTEVWAASAKRSSVGLTYGLGEFEKGAITH